jgi:hypothetical protein
MIATPVTSLVHQLGVAAKALGAGLARPQTK